MSVVHEVYVRADEDIAAEIDHLITHYPPLAHDRHALTIEVEAGQVTVRGNVMSPNTAEYLLHRLGDVAGVQGVKADQLYDDQTLRLEIARLLPPGVMVAMMRQGQVVLTGDLTPNSNFDALAAPLVNLPGVRRVINGFGG